MQESQEMWIQTPGQGDPLEEGTGTHTGILAWKFPWTKEPGRLHFIGSQSQTRLKRLSTVALSSV